MNIRVHPFLNELFARKKCKKFDRNTKSALRVRIPAKLCSVEDWQNVIFNIFVFNISSVRKNICICVNIKSEISFFIMNYQRYFRKYLCGIEWIPLFYNGVTRCPLFFTYQLVVSFQVLFLLIMTNILYVGSYVQWNFIDTELFVHFFFTVNHHKKLIPFGNNKYISQKNGTEIRTIILYSISTLST